MRSRSAALLFGALSLACGSATSGEDPRTGRPESPAVARARTLLVADAGRAGDTGDESSGKALSGIVVDGDEQPVPEANVWLVGSGLDLEPEVQAHGRTDGEGRFEISVPDRWFTRLANQPGTHAVCAWKAGMRIAARAMPQQSLSAAGSVRLVLQPAEPVVLTVHDPGGQPASAIRVRVEALALSSGMLFLPDEISVTSAVTTDGEGRGELAAVAPDLIGRIVLESEKFGEQHLLIPPNGGWTSPLVLSPAGRLVGRITAPEPGLVSGLHVDVATRPSVR
jgi:hypothetical protein